MSDVPDEAVEAAFESLHNQHFVIGYEFDEPCECGVKENAHRHVAREAIEAAAPFLVAAERQRLHDRIEALGQGLAAELERSGFFGWLLSNADSALWVDRTPEQEMARVVVAFLGRALVSPVSDDTGGTKP